jgi:Fe-S-cluster containining protein
MDSDSERKIPGPKPWWHGGLRFACQGSGKCCVSHGSDCYVFVTLEDRRRLAATLNIPTRHFTRRYCSKHEELFHLGTDNKSCVFLDGRRCSVYEGRPTQCRTWPFWPENMRAKKWDRVAAFCPGVGKGQVVEAETIRKILKKQRRSNAKL